MWPEASNRIPKDPYLREAAEPRHDTYRESVYYSPELWTWHRDIDWAEGMGDKAGQRIVSEDTEYCPWVSMRWLKAAGEARGRSPVMQAIGDIRTANKLMEIHLKNANLQMAGVFSVKNGGIINPATTVIRPGARLTVQSNATADPSIRPLDVGGNAPLAFQLIADQRMAIKEALLDLGLPEETAGVRSATEIVERMKQLYQDIGAPIARIQHEGGTGVMKAVVAMASRAGYLEAMTAPATGRPQAMRIGGNGVRLRFKTQLSRTEELEQLSRLSQFGEIGRFLAGEESYTLKVKTDEILEEVARLLNVKTDLLQDEQKAQAVMEQMRMAVAQGAGQGQRLRPAEPPQSGIV